MAEGTGILPGLPAVAGKPVHVGFDGGRLTSDAGILLLAAIEQRLRIAERLAACLEDPRDPERVWHELAEMIRFCHGPQYVSIPLSYSPVAGVLLLSGVGAWPPPDGVG
jgi:hypothetical protein